MFNAQLLRVALFLALVVMVYVWTAAILLRWAIRRKRGHEPRTSRLDRIVLALAAIGTLCIVYGVFLEPRWPEVTHVQIRSPKLPKQLQPIRIVLISDLHCEREPLLEERLPEIITREKPDLIVFTGDALNTADGLPVLKRLMTRLRAIAPTFAVRGNWDVVYWGKLNLYGSTGVRELNAEAVEVEFRGATLWIAGVPYGREEQIRALMNGAFPSSVNIFISHMPDSIEQVAQHGADIYLAGHTHGGQVRLPFYGALITLSRYDKRFEAGLKRVGQTWIYVTRGIGMEGRAPFRFLSRPEITVIELVPQ
jgi:predicted MPP superfamily phosphohydrolase